MMHDIKVTVYYGPLVWFEDQVDEEEDEGLLEEACAHDERHREIRVIQEGEESSKYEEFERPNRLIAKSGDYASLSEHVISNFPGLIKSLAPF